MSKKAAAEELRRFANGLRNVIEIADDLTKLGNMEAEEAGAKARLSALEIQQQTAESAIFTARNEAAEIKRTAEADAQAIREDADAVKVRADNDAEAATQAANAKAGEIVAEATRRKTAIESEITALTATRDSAKAEADAATQLRDEINADLERVRRKVA